MLSLIQGVQQALVFIFVLNILVGLHEFGHLIVARLCGIRVERFSIGFGKALFGWKFAGIDFVFAPWLLGGYVKMAGESAEEAIGKPWEFNSKPLLQKFAVVFAGPLMNALLAFVLFFIIFTAGMPVLTARVGKVMDGMPAQAAGLQAGDKIVSVNGTAVKYWEDLTKITRGGADELLLVVERDKGTREITVRPVKKDLTDVFGRPARMTVIGIEPSKDMVYVKSPFPQSLFLAWDRVWKTTGIILSSLWFMIIGALPFKESMSGPIGIFFMTNQAAAMGWAPLLAFMASLSLSLFVLNLLPIPVLDGGHVLFILIEKIKGSPIRNSTKERMTQIGFLLLMALMFFVIFHDLDRFSVFKNIKNLIIPAK